MQLQNLQNDMKFYPFIDRKYELAGGHQPLVKIATANMRYEEKLRSIQDTYKVSMATATAWLKKVKTIENNL